MKVWATTLIIYYFVITPNHNVFFLTFFIVVQVEFPAFSPYPSPLPQPSPPPSPVSTPPCYCPCVLYNSSYKSFTLFPYNPLPSPFWSLSACAQFQCLWLIPLLGLYPKNLETPIQKNLCSPMFIAAQFTIDKF